MNLECHNAISLFIKHITIASGRYNNSRRWRRIRVLGTRLHCR
jgi:hypothetical protein